MAEWKPGDVANGHVLGEDLVWRRVDDGPAEPPLAPSPPTVQASPPAAPVQMDSGAGATNKPAIVSLVAGIVALPANIFFLPTIVAVVAGIMGLVRAKQLGGLGKAKAIWGIVTGTVGAAIALTLFSAFLPGYFGDSSETDGSLGHEATVSAGAEPLLLEFDADATAASAKYKGQWIQVSGVVAGLSKETADDLDPEYYSVLHIGGEPDWEYVTVNCHGIPTDYLAAFPPGDKIRVVGEFDKGGKSGVEIKNCRLA